MNIWILWRFKNRHCVMLSFTFYDVVGIYHGKSRWISVQCICYVCTFVRSWCWRYETLEAPQLLRLKSCYCQNLIAFFFFYKKVKFSFNLNEWEKKHKQILYHVLYNFVNIFPIFVLCCDFSAEILPHLSTISSILPLSFDTTAATRYYT